MFAFFQWELGSACLSSLSDGLSSRVRIWEIPSPWAAIRILSPLINPQLVWTEYIDLRPLADQKRMKAVAEDTLVLVETFVERIFDYPKLLAMLQAAFWYQFRLLEKVLGINRFSCIQFSRSESAISHHDSLVAYRLTLSPLVNLVYIGAIWINLPDASDLPVWAPESTAGDMILLVP